MFVLVKNTIGIEVVINNACSFVDLLWRAYFETRTGLGPGLGLEENPDSRKTRTRTRKKSGLVFNKTRT
jgi:hypothetical protein